MALMRDFQSQARRHGAPVTVAIILIAAANFLASWVSQGGAWNVLLVFLARNFPALPWTALTYPFAATMDIIGLLLMGYWLWVIGAMVERELGTVIYSIFFALMTLIPALMMWVGYLALGALTPLAGLYLPVAAITIAWATRYPETTMLFMMVFPIKAKWLGWITAVLIVFSFGMGNPVLGFLAAFHLLLAYLYAANKIPGVVWGKHGFVPKKQTWLPREKDDRYLDDVKRRETERAERERLRKLFEGSLGEDPEDKR